MVDRTRARLTVPQLKTLFGAKRRPRRDQKQSPSRLEAVLETSAYDLTVFKLHFGNPSLKAHTKGECVLRFEVTVHNTRELGCGRVVARFPEIVGRLMSMLERFLAWARRASAGGPQPGPDTGRLGRGLALAPAPTGFSLAQFTAKVQALADPIQRAYSRRQAAYDLKRLRGKQLIFKVGSSRRYQVPPDGARTIAALLTLRDQVIKPVLSGTRLPKHGPKPSTWITLDRHYEQLRLDMQLVFHDLGIAAETSPCRSHSRKRLETPPGACRLLLGRWCGVRRMLGVLARWLRLELVLVEQQVDGMAVDV